jgi:hypothetical protein
MLGEALWRQDRHFAGRHVGFLDNAAYAAVMVDVRMTGDDGDQRPPAAMLGDEIVRGLRRFGGNERIEYDPAGLTLDEANIGEIVPAHLENAVVHLEESVLHVELRVAPQAWVYGGGCGCGGADVSLGQVVKRYVKRRVASVEHRVVRGTEAAIAGVLATTHRGSGMNTSDIERLNATFHASLAPLVRRGRAIAHTKAALTAGMWLVGCTDNVCWLHESLRQRAPVGAPWNWQERTPAIAAGLTHHRWTMLERLRYHVSLPPWVAPKHRGRPSKRALYPALALGT